MDASVTGRLGPCRTRRSVLRASDVNPPQTSDVNPPQTSDVNPPQTSDATPATGISPRPATGAYPVSPHFSAANTAFMRALDISRQSD
jgi:hypothetical protein